MDRCGGNVYLMLLPACIAWPVFCAFSRLSTAGVLRTRSIIIRYVASSNPLQSGALGFPPLGATRSDYLLILLGIP